MSAIPAAHRPQLDGLRTFAVLVVILSHYAPRSWWRVLPEGSRGVELFFVLSGFLISSILWRGRLAVERRETVARRVWGRFLIRRTLRIFPIYYLMILFAVVAGLGITTHELKWYASYAANIYFVRRGSVAGPTSILWSLAVEEQFYLLWPAILLFFPRRAVKLVLGGALFLALAYRVRAVLQGLPFREFLLPGCIDMFAAGAILGILFVEKHPARRRFERACLAASVLLFAAVELLPESLLPRLIANTLARSAMGLISVWLVGGAERGFRGPAGAVLSARPVVYLGRISYGIYLYHSFVAESFVKLRMYYGLPALSPVANLLLDVVVTVGAAAASWHFLEEPIARLKDRWSGSGRPGIRSVAPSSALPAVEVP